MSEDFAQQIREKARELLEKGEVTCVIGYETGTDGRTARPAFIYDAADADRLVFDNTCTHNLAKYLLNKKGQPTAVVVKACDARALNLLLGEKQIKREEFFAIGVVCPGVVESGWMRQGETLQLRCQGCTEHTPPLYDFLVGEPAEEPAPEPSYEDVAEIEGMELEGRTEFWAKQFERCIRCYGCRQVCPGCFCIDCFAELLDPEWVGIRIAPPEKQMWNLIRAFHLTGRCIGCRECERVCPVNIPLSLLNRKMEKEVLRLFGFKAGMSPEALMPLATYSKEDKLGIGE